MRNFFVYTYSYDAILDSDITAARTEEDDFAITNRDLLSPTFFRQPIESGGREAGMVLITVGQSYLLIWSFALRHHLLSPIGIT